VRSPHGLTWPPASGPTRALCYELPCAAGQGRGLQTLWAQRLSLSVPTSPICRPMSAGPQVRVVECRQSQMRVCDGTREAVAPALYETPDDRTEQGTDEIRHLLQVRCPALHTDSVGLVSRLMSAGGCRTDSRLPPSTLDFPQRPRTRACLCRARSVLAATVTALLIAAMPGAAFEKGWERRHCVRPESATVLRPSQREGMLP
jgi:hypothetical protein